VSQSKIESSAAEAVAVLEREESLVDFRRESREAFADWLAHGSLTETAPPEPTPAMPETVTDREIAFEGTLRINGYLAGVIRSRQGTLMLEAEGEVDADVFVNRVVIHGRLRGDIHASEHVRLGGSARVTGDIETVTLSIEPGAVFEGRCIFLEEQSEIG